MYLVMKMLHVIDAQVCSLSHQLCQVSTSEQVAVGCSNWRVTLPDCVQ